MLLGHVLVADVVFRFFASFCHLRPKSKNEEGLRLDVYTRQTSVLVCRSWVRRSASMAIKSIRYVKQTEDHLRVVFSMCGV